MELDFVNDTQTQEMEDDGASVLFHNLFSHTCVRRVGDPEFHQKTEKKKEKRPHQTQSGRKNYCECSFIFLYFCYFLSFFSK